MGPFKPVEFPIELVMKRWIARRQSPACIMRLSLVWFCFVCPADVESRGQFASWTHNLNAAVAVVLD